MKYIAIIFVTFFIVSCGQQRPDNEKIIKSNPYLIGKWMGEGRFLDTDLFKEVGMILVEIEITKDNEVFARIGEAIFTNTSIHKANYGFEIKGKLDRKVSNSTDLDKDCAIILLVLSTENSENASFSDANFHLKSNFTFDFGMRVGGVKLIKEK